MKKSDTVETCPRCGEAKKRPDQKVCTNCYLSYYCPVCKTRLDDPLGNFCGECAAEIKQRPWPGLETTPSEPERNLLQKSESAELSTQPSFCPQCGFPVEPEHTFCGECGFDLTQAAPESSFTAKSVELAPPGSDELLARVLRYKPARGLRRTYFDLGLALKAAGRYKEAIEAFGNALRATGNTPPGVDILFQQAHSYELGTNPERAFRTYLEAVRRAPNEASVVLPHVHPLVSSAVVQENGAWLASEWAACLDQPQVRPLSGVYLAAFLGRAQLFLGHAEAALAAFERAMQADRQLAPGVIAPLLTPATLPPEYNPAANNGLAQYTLARIWRVVGQGADALRTVEIALNLDLGGENYPEAPVQRLKADLLLDAGRKTDAAQWYYEAGQRYVWRSEFDQAAELLEKSVGLKADPAACWTWMEAERSRAYLSQPPYAIPSAVQLSRKAWKTGLKSGWPGPAYFWVYTTRALLAELEARLDVPQRVDHWWNAIQWLEAAELLSENDVYSWAYLGRFFRYLNLNACAEQATRRAMDMGEENMAALEERAAILANIGQYDEALTIIERRQKLGANAWVGAVNAYIIIASLRATAAETLYRGEIMPVAAPEIAKYREALRLVDQTLASEYPDIWYRELRTVCLRSLPGQLSEARAEAERIYTASLDPNLAENPDTWLSRGWAALFTGRASEAAAAFTALLQDPILAGAGWRSLGVCLLAGQEFDRGEENMLTGIQMATVARECDDTLNDLQDFAPNLPQERRARLTQRIAERRAQLAQLPTPLDELNGVMADTTTLSKAGHTGREASLAVMGRMALAEGRFKQALEFYQKMSDPGYPGRSQGLSKSWAGWQNVVDGLLKARHFEDARQELFQLMAMLPQDKNPEPLADLQARLALAYFSLDQVEDARNSYERAIQAGNETQWVSAGERIGEIWRDLLADPAQLWQVDAELEEMARDGRTSEEVERTRDSLPLFLERYFQLDRQLSGGDTPFALPIQVWVGRQLEPLVDPQIHEHFIKQDLPAVRQRIRADTGIGVPAMKVSVDNSMQASYQIDFYERRYARGEVFPQMNYCSASLENLVALGIPREALMPAVDPLSGQPGCWVAAEQAGRVTASGAALGGPMDFILRDLEAQLRRFLALFIDVAMVQRLLGRLDARWNELMELALPDPSAHLAFARLVRVLVREGVPVKHLDELLQAIPPAGLNPANFAEVLRAARLRLIDQLPANPGGLVLAVPAQWENRLRAWLVDHNGRTEFSPPPGEGAELLDAVRQWTKDAERPGALVVQDPALRPFLRVMIENQYPAWPVQAQEELRFEPAQKEDGHADSRT
jgi:tetratricopeptide (TPR) repeat protein